jgi:SAM-dependent methyltransferase
MAKTSYTDYIDSLENQLGDSHSHDEIMRQAVGGAFEIVGLLERELLIQQGLPADGYLVDVGCGSGRLAQPLADYLQGQYLGIDIVPKLVDYARTLVNRPDWRFEVAQGFTIPEKDEQADMVCFFSVLTHLRHEESYLYLQEARRVLKPVGKIVFSFLEFTNPVNWGIFQHNINAIGADEPLNQFISVDAIKVWAYHLGLPVLHINRAGQIDLPKPIQLANDQIVEGRHFFGQSICVLSKKAHPVWRQKLNNGLWRFANRLTRLQV